MFTPEPMQRVDIFLLEEETNTIVRALAQASSLHVIDQRKINLSPSISKTIDKSDIAEECRGQANLAGALLERLEVVCRRLGSDDRTKIMQSDSNRILERAKSSLSEMQQEIDGLLHGMEEVRGSIARLDFIAEEMQHLDKMGISLAELSSLQSLYFAHGIMQRSALKSLQDNLEGSTCYYSTREIPGQRVSLLLFGHKEDGDVFTSALAQAGLRHHDIPRRFHLSMADSLDLVEAELWQNRDDLALLTQKLRNNRDKWRKQLSYWKAAMEIHHGLLQATAKFGCTGKAVLISGFIPDSKLEQTVTRLRREAPDRHFIQAVPAVDKREIRVPTRLANNAFFRLFEPMVTTYGLPGYREIDPTVFLGLSFLLMFGMMFGDVGHGLVLALIGAGITWLPYRIFLPMRSLGRVVIMAGLAGTFFGFLFGSVFGVEEDSVLPALWMRPSHQENLTLFLGTAMCLGIGMISLGIILNIIQSLRQGRKQQAMFGQWSAASLVFYWMALGLMGAWAAGWKITISPWFLAAVMAVPLLLIVGGHLLVSLRKPEHDGEKHEIEIATLFLEPVEIVMNLFSNTLSFMRVGAFGLAHAALCMATFIIKDMIPGDAAGMLSLPIEHMTIIVLEGMIVTIQCLRLEYYEFFSKFFAGGGVAYTPLSADWTPSLEQGD